MGPFYKNPSVSNPLLEGAYRNSLALANEHGLEAVAFPAIRYCRRILVSWLGGIHPCFRSSCWVQPGPASCLYTRSASGVCRDAHLQCRPCLLPCPGAYEWHHRLRPTALLPILPLLLTYLLLLPRLLLLLPSVLLLLPFSCGVFRFPINKAAEV